MYEKSKEALELQCLLFTQLTSPLPARPFLDGVRDVIELQVHGRAFGKVAKALCFRDLVFHLLQVRHHGSVLLLELPAAVTCDAILHGDAHRVGL